MYKVIAHEVIGDLRLPGKELYCGPNKAFAEKVKRDWQLTHAAPAFVTEIPYGS